MYDDNCYDNEDDYCPNCGARPCRCAADNSDVEWEDRRVDSREDDAE